MTVERCPYRNPGGEQCARRISHYGDCEPERLVQSVTSSAPWQEPLDELRGTLDEHLVGVDSDLAKMERRLDAHKRTITILAWLAPLQGFALLALGFRLRELADALNAASWIHALG